MSIRQIATTVGTVSPSAGDVAGFGADLLIFGLIYNRSRTRELLRNSLSSGVGLIMKASFLSVRLLRGLNLYAGA